ncbi:hypothetical protein [Stigmatella hybrida]|uniref:hypothetical protein n=1 Tax=Stigmatella hybrida TaxID=394097 RepID=UPI001CDADBAD|nr:hypothetical protein [Stigmatella hybrida]
MKTHFKRSTLALMTCFTGLTASCSHFGYYKHQKAERAPAEEAAAIKFPDSMEQGTHLTGPMMAALKVAMDDYRPPGLNPDALKPPDSCLARWDFIQTTVLQASDTLFYIDFSPDLRQCGPGFIMLDSGATYAVDNKGRILSRN